jgi:hypothetical protein
MTRKDYIYHEMLISFLFDLWQHTRQSTALKLLIAVCNGSPYPKQDRA